MKLVKRLISLFLILSNLFLLCGCWNYSDIEKVLLVVGFAIDKNEQGDKYIVTVEVVDFEMSGTQAKQTSKFFESEGRTIFDAIRNSISIIGKRLYWAHANVVIISQELAREGIAPLIDLIIRDTEMREEKYVLISKEKTAKEVLKQEMLLSQSSSNNIERMLSNQSAAGNAPVVKAYELMGTLEDTGISVALPALHLIKNTDKKTAELDGTAVFKSDKLIGFLSPDETKAFLFITNKIHGGLATLKEPSSSKTDNISLEIFKSKTKLKPRFSDEKLTMNIDIVTEVAIAEVQTSEDYITEKRDALKSDAEKKFKALLETVIKKAQNEFDSDIFGFGKIIKAELPSVWRKSQQKGTNLFKELAFDIHVEIKILTSSLSAEPIKKGD